MASTTTHCYAIIRNIPKEYRSQDLRSFFHDAVNYGHDDQIFAAFNFRHRPELKIINSEEQEQQASSSRDFSTCCCLVKIGDYEKRRVLIENYNGRRWTDRFGKEHAFLKCFVSPVKITREEETTVVELKFDGKFMPQGNVGTPDTFFAEKIRNCTLPTNVIKKLNLDNCWLKLNAKKRQYSQVPPPSSNIEEDFLAKNVPNPDIIDDKDECEEFERHEANHDDVDEQSRTKERLYEKEMEIVWEKGGPGLVFYTDSFFWDQQKGTDTDERWTDDWDVDVRAFYGAENEADKDARDLAQMRREEAGVFESAFKKKKKMEILKKNVEESDHSPDFGSFEKHTKAVGRRLLLEQGWREGRGLGAEWNPGQLLPVALDLEERSQTSKTKTGLGYRGEKLQRINLTKKSNDDEKRFISTIYDKQRGNEKADGVYRRNEVTYEKYRKNVKNFIE